MTKRRWWLVAGVAAIAIVAGFAASRAPAVRVALRAFPRGFHLPRAAKPRRARRGGMDVTFLVTGDTHFGVPGIAERHEAIIADMNSVAGRPFPAEIGGAVGAPRGVLIAGDLTDDSRPEEWDAFVAHYGLHGGDGLLRYPVYEGIGNHDKNNGWYVKKRVAERHGGQRYAFDWDDLHVVCLGEAPDDDDLAWLREDLAAAGDAGVVLFFHYPLSGPYPDTWFARGSYRQSFAEVLMGANVLAIFHGHYHASGSYRWMGNDVYLSGSAKHSEHSYTVVHVGNERMQVASWNYDDKRWWWWHDKPTFAVSGAEIRHIPPEHQVTRDVP